MSKTQSSYCKILDYDLTDLDSFDHLKGLTPKRLFTSSLSIFSAKNPEKLVVFSEKAIDTKEISLHFQQDSDFQDFSSNFLNKYETFAYEGVFSGYDNQESLYISLCKRLLSSFLDNQENCGVLLLGPSRYFLIKLNIEDFYLDQLKIISCEEANIRKKA